mgnify:CR=1 FL=1
MEYFDQGYGYIIYETEAFVDDKGAEIVLPEIHDIAHIESESIFFIRSYGSYFLLAGCKEPVENL